MTKDEILKGLRKRRDAIAKERDAIRDLLDEWGSIEDSATRGIEALEDAVDSLSEHL